MPKICSVQECGRKHYAFGLCEKHYQRNQKYGDPLQGVKNHAPPEERFWRFVEKSEESNGCWNWTGGSRNQGGYGVFQIGGKGSLHTGAHRFSYQMAYGPIPEGYQIRHQCNNRQCVRPDHMLTGTAKENMDDQFKFGRRRTVAPLGIENGKHRLVPDDVRFIRRHYEINNAELARLLKVSINCIRGARIGRTWKHVK